MLSGSCGLEQGERVVLNGHVPKKSRRISERLLEISHEPAEKVHYMNSLVQEFAPAAQFPVGAPLLIVARPPTMTVPATQEIQATQFTRIHYRFCLHYGRVVPVIEAGLQYQAVIPATF